MVLHLQVSILVVLQGALTWVAFCFQFLFVGCQQSKQRTDSEKTFQARISRRFPLTRLFREAFGRWNVVSRNNLFWIYNLTTCPSAKETALVWDAFAGNHPFRAFVQGHIQNAACWCFGRTSWIWFIDNAHYFEAMAWLSVTIADICLARWLIQHNTVHRCAITTSKQHSIAPFSSGSSRPPSIHFVYPWTHG